MITPEEVARLFELSKMSPTPEELETFPKEIDAILSYVKVLHHAPTRDTAPIISFAPKYPLLRADDVITREESDRDALKEQFPASKDGYVKTKNVFDNTV